MTVMLQARFMEQDYQSSGTDFYVDVHDRGVYENVEEAKKLQTNIILVVKIFMFPMLVL